MGQATQSMDQEEGKKIIEEISIPLLSGPKECTAVYIKID